MPDRPCITHIITGLEVGGAERALHVLLTGGLQRTFDNRVISLAGPGHYGPILAAEGIPVGCLGMQPGRPGPRQIWELRRMIHQNPPDLIQGWMYHGNLAATAAGRLVSVPTKVAWNIRRSREAAEDMRVSTNAIVRIGSWLSSWPDAILYNSVRSRNQHESDGYAANCAHVIPNGFDTVRWRPEPLAATRLRQELALAEDVRIIGFVARSHPDKDPGNLFHAYARIAEKFPSWHLVCVGKGLADVASGKLDPSRVSFLGERWDMPQVMPGFDLLCLSSQVEGFPNVLGEAMACGVPCVSTDVGDAIPILGKTGWAVPPRNSAALADALSQAMMQPMEDLRIRGQTARQRIIDYYSLHSVIEHYRILYTTLLGEC
ncbi:MAG TPA: glycosyltransferase [Bellilinea sp.]|nr:glycosyltransferase [Bellilinea sp.]